MGGNFHGTYLAFHIHVVQVGVGAVGLRIGAEGDADVVYLVSEFLYVDLPVVQESVLDAIQGDGPVHGSAIDINVTYFAGQVFSHSTFSTGGETVNGNGYLFHVAIYNKVFIRSNGRSFVLKRKHFIFCSKKHAKDKAIFKISRYICSTKAKVAF